MPRSGATAVTFNNKMYIFGGIYELTKELNDMVVYDFAAKRFQKGEEPPEHFDSPEKRNAMTQQETFNDQSASPTRTNKYGSPTRKGRTMNGGSPMRSPTKRNRATSPNKKGKEGKTDEENDGLSSPISYTMQNTFIIKNADSSFDTYYQAMRKRK